MFTVPSRFASVFTSIRTDKLWEGVTGPKGSTKKRARGKRRVTRPRVDLHLGQRIGMGKASIKWPGLNAPLLSSAALMKIEKGKDSDEYFKHLDELRSKSGVKRKRIKLPPLLRGWTGSRLGGQSLGPLPGYKDFDTRVIEMKVVATMTATVGRYRRFSAVVATGNGHGLCGIGKATAITLSAATRRAKQRAAKNLVSFEIKDRRTLWHTGYVHEWKSTIFAIPLPEGAGLVCHRVIRTLCEVIGIKDMYAKVEGTTKNYQVLARGFLRLLSEQESYTELANRIGLNIVEFTPDRDMFPRILASPASGITTDLCTIKTDEQRPKTDFKMNNNNKLSILAISNPERRKPPRPKLEEYNTFLNDLVDVGEEEVELDEMNLLAAGERDINSIYLKGKIPLIKKIPLPGYLKNPGNLKRAAERYRYRHHEEIQRERQVQEDLMKDMNI